MFRAERSGGARQGIVAAVTLGIGCIVAACQLPTGLPSNSEPFTPPAVFQRWWAMTEACSGRSGNMAAVRFYRVPGSKFTVGGRDVAAFYDQGENKILLTDSIAAFGAAVRHEMLHALGVAGHPRADYLERCAGVVQCASACAADGGAWRAPDAWIAIKGESLVVKATAELLPSNTDDERWLTIRTRVTNPWSRAVLATMPPTSFAYALTHDVPAGATVQDAMYAPDSSTFFFRANETKEFTFELVVRSDFSRYSLPPGDYRFLGGFGDTWTRQGRISVSRAQATGALEAQTP